LPPIRPPVSSCPIAPAPARRSASAPGGSSGGEVRPVGARAVDLGGVRRQPGGGRDFADVTRSGKVQKIRPAPAMPQPPDGRTRVPRGRFGVSASRSAVVHQRLVDPSPLALAVRARARARLEPRAPFFSRSAPRCRCTFAARALPGRCGASEEMSSRIRHRISGASDRQSSRPDRRCRRTPATS